MDKEDEVKKVRLGREGDRVEVEDFARDEPNNYIGLASIVNNSFEQVNAYY